MEKVNITIDEQIAFIKKEFEYHDRLDNINEYQHLAAILETLIRFKYLQR